MMMGSERVGWHTVVSSVAECAVDVKEGEPRTSGCALEPLRSSTVRLPEGGDSSRVQVVSASEDNEHACVDMQCMSNCLTCRSQDHSFKARKLLR
jgi:hypothetical protein